MVLLSVYSQTSLKRVLSLFFRLTRWNVPEAATAAGPNSTRSVPGATPGTGVARTRMGLRPPARGPRIEFKIESARSLQLDGWYVFPTGFFRSMV